MTKDHKKNYDFEDDSRERSRLNIESKLLLRWLAKLSNFYEDYGESDFKYWSHFDANEKHLTTDARKTSQDNALVWQAIANYIIDFVLFHNIVDFMIKLGLPNCPEWIVLVVSFIFPIGFFIGELAMNYWICHVKWIMDDQDDDIGAKFWFVFVCFWGLLYALFPSATFAIVMEAAKESTNQSWILTAVLAILGIAIHLVLIFGGQHVIDAKTRLSAKLRHSRLEKARRNHKRKLTQAVLRVRQKQGDSILPRSTDAPIEFEDEKYHLLHPMGRPLKFRFGSYGNRQHDDDQGSPPPLAA